MKKKLFISLLLMLSLNSYSQILFEKGYIIKNTGEKVVCLIKNIDWKNNPTEIEYKMSETADIKVANINDIIEFGVDNYSTYVRKTVDIDRSTEKVPTMSNNRKPDFKKETLFLKVLIKGKASLYKYVDSELYRYFFKVDDQPVKQLIYKQYRLKNTSENSELGEISRIRENITYKSQIYKNLKCPSITFKRVNSLSYKHNDLVKIFIEYNNCTNSEFVDFDKNAKKTKVNVSVKLGVNNTSLSIENEISHFRNANFNSESGLIVGFEVEAILPFNKNKWGVFAEPTYQNYITKNEYDDIIVNYKYLDVPVGIRHYFFLKNNSKIFIDGALMFNFAMNDATITYLEVDSSINLGFGLGYKYNKFFVELRTQTTRRILTNYSHWNSYFNTSAVILGYTIY